MVRAPTTISVPPIRGTVQGGSGVRKQRTRKRKTRKHKRRKINNVNVLDVKPT